MRLSRHFRSSLRGLSVSAATLICLPTIVSRAQDQTVNGNLTVNGNVSSAGILSSQTSGTPELYLNKIGTIGWSVRNNGSFNVFNWQDSSFPLTILNNDNIGIGTTAPSKRLTVAGGQIGIDNGTGIWARDANGTYRNLANANADNSVSFGDGEGGWTALRFFAGASEALRIQSNGDVGIGTAAPSEKVDIVGGRMRIVDVSGQYGWIFGSDQNHSIIMRGDRDGTPVNATNYYQYGGPLSDGNKGHRFWTCGLLATQGERMRIADDGVYIADRLGIGTASPNARLDVKGTLSLSDAGNRLTLFGKTNTSWTYDIRNDQVNALTIQSQYPQATPFAIDCTGAVGIGTMTPGAKLDVGGDVRVAGNLTVGGALTAPGYTASTGAINGSTTGLALNAGGSNQNVTITPTGTGATVLNGNVGIGSANPSQKLDVNGNVLVRGGAFYVPGNHYFSFVDLTDEIPVLAVHGTASYAPRLDLFTAGDANTSVSLNATGTTYFNGGNVAIGTTTADKALTVKGTIHATEVVVDTTVAAKDLKVQPKAWADDVFDDGRPLQPLSAVEQSIKEHKHLPGVPSAQEVAANGVSVADMQTVLLQKIEELTLHQIEQEKLLQAQADRITRLETENASLRAHPSETLK